MLRVLRLLSVLPALAGGAWLLHQGWTGPLDNLFGYQDSPAWVYLLVGATYVLPGLALLAYGAWTLARGVRRVSGGRSSAAAPARRAGRS